MTRLSATLLTSVCALVPAGVFSSKLTCAGALAQERIGADMQKKIDLKTLEIRDWARTPSLIEALKTHNASPPKAAQNMTQEKWKSLSMLDPLVKEILKNKTSQWLKSKKDETVSEAFVSGANGTKIAFLAKTSNWTHNGKDKHDEPMKGKVWQGIIEIDDSTGTNQIQVGVPILDGGKPIGSLVVGLRVEKLK